MFKCPSTCHYSEPLGSGVAHLASPSPQIPEGTDHHLGPVDQSARHRVQIARVPQGEVAGLAGFPSRYPGSQLHSVPSLRSPNLI